MPLLPFIPPTAPEWLKEEELFASSGISVYCELLLDLRFEEPLELLSR